MEHEKFPKPEIPESFLRRYRIIFIAIAGLGALHVAWWRFVQTHVPADERPKKFEFLGKLDPIKMMDAKK